MRRGFPAVPRLFGAADPHPLSCRCCAKEVRSCRGSMPTVSQQSQGQDQLPLSSCDIPKQGCHNSQGAGTSSPASKAQQGHCNSPAPGMLLHHTGRVKEVQRSHTITPARLLVIHLNTKIAPSASCSTQYPQRIMLKRLTFLSQQHEAGTPQREEFSRMSLILKCPITPVLCSPIPLQLAMNFSPKPQHLPILSFVLLTLSLSKLVLHSWIYSRIQSFPAESRSAPQPIQLLPWFPPS